MVIKLLDEIIYTRVTKWGKKLIKQYNIKTSKVFRRALTEKIKEITQEYPDKDMYAYAAAWNRVSSEVCSILNEDDIELLKKSDEKRHDLQRIVASLLSPKSLENFAVFLQGGKLSDHILNSFFNFNNDGGKNDGQNQSK